MRTVRGSGREGVVDPADATEAWPEFGLKYEYGSDVYEAFARNDLVVYRPVSGMEDGGWIVAGEASYVSVESVR
ncbi:hypothetical protein ACFO0N_16975 [Halobium salinum]|uniref:Uncharacterized protein n=1 Tax=Halobium salinum TaxID=1364940 RepID=A0ABD5PFZ4_9EURY|nr:hypothetical protein [Halobium salinum]